MYDEDYDMGDGGGHLQFICRKTGLSKEELLLCIRCLNGIGLPPAYNKKRNHLGALIDKEFLSDSIFCELQNAHGDVASHGSWLETGSNNPDEPYQLNDVHEKIKALDEDEADALLYFISGFWYSRTFLR